MTPPCLRFGRFELFPRDRRLLADGAPVALGARAFDLLVVLAERPGQLVTKTELLDLVWPGLVVEENNIAAQVVALRKALGGDSIATVPGRGYRFMGRLDGAPSPRLLATITPFPPAPPSAEPPKLRTNLPATLTTLIGRDDELAALDTLVTQHRLVAIVGAGGMGKTLLALNLLRRHETRWRHGVCWVELGPLTDAAALPGAIAAALDLRPGGSEPLAGLARAVAPLELLVVLDNAEHLLEATAQVATALLDAAPGLHLVVTSQAPLKLAAERVHRISALAVPQGPLPAVQALGFGAVALFTERAQAVDSRFALTDDNAPAVIELCRALDGLALAIELAAVRAPMLGVHKLAGLMHERLKLLSRGANRAAPQRQQTLRATLEWSHALLGQAEQVVFRRLAVMVGSADLALIQQVVADLPGEGELDDWVVLDALDILVERSLVIVLASDDAQEPRYRLLDSPRAFARERLTGAGEERALRQRHARAVAARFGPALDERYSGRIGMVSWTDRMQPDLDNAQEALAWARACSDIATALAIAPALLRATPPAAHAEGAALAQVCETLADHGPPGLPQFQAWLMASNHWSDTRPQHSLILAERALRLARDLAAGDGGQVRWLYFALCRYANTAALSGSLDAAQAALREARALEPAGAPAVLLLERWSAETALAGLHADASLALHAARETMRLAAAAGSHGHTNMTALIDAQVRLGDLTAAVRDGQVFVAQLEGTRYEKHLAYARLNLTAAHLSGDELAEAHALARAGWPQALRFEMQAWWADYLALLAALEGRPADAARLAGYADAVYLRHQDHRQANEAAAVERARALARAALGDAEAARLQAEGARLRDEDIAAIALADSSQST